MPAAIAVPLIITAVSAGASIYQSAEANKRAKNAQKKIDDYKRQDLGNPYENMQTSTLAADRQREDLSRSIATTANLASAGGSRAIAALAPQLIAQQNTQEAQILANLDEQEKERQRIIASGEAQRQGMMEQRENNDLLGLGNNLAIAEQQKADAQNNLTQSIIQGAGSVAMGAMGSSAAKSAIGTIPTTPISKPVATTVPAQAPAILPNSMSTWNFPQGWTRWGTRKSPSWTAGLNGTYSGLNY
ncbi:hypothetical protein [uncultured Chryseobacterium sp.]|uniref:hypothetical protein n=1 Tax=uncultured Chryseobacterium sp. TaxID=259322 RepID=UPI0025E23758|nr:hypothetical protein [uncultured Chryseobacterium sp.]